MGDQGYDEDIQLQDWKLDGREIIESIYLLLTAQKRSTVKGKTGLVPDTDREPLCSKRIAKTISTVLSSYLHAGVVLSTKEDFEIMREMMVLAEDLIYYLWYDEETYELKDAQRSIIANIVIDNVKSTLNRSKRGMTIKIMGQVVKKTITETHEVKDDDKRKAFGKILKRPEGGDDGVLF